MSRCCGLLMGWCIAWSLWALARADEAKSEPAAGEAANILVLLADDVDWRDFGCYGNSAIRTPNIDRLAREGMLCRNAFLTTSQCSPTRISVLTGKYPHATGAEDLHVPLPEGEVFVSSLLKHAGYFTGHLRKTHYGPNGDKQFDWYSKNTTDLDQFLDASGGRPFFLWVGFTDAHRPYRPGAVDPPHEPAQVRVPPYLIDDDATRADLALYYDAIARMDGEIGAMLEVLQRRNLADNTLVVFFGDNGMPFPRAKGTLYDSGIGTPLVIRWPRVVTAGSVVEGMVSVIDLAPTFLDAAGLPPGKDMQGESMLPLLADSTWPTRNFVFSERNWHGCDEHLRSVRTDRFKLIRNAYLELPHGTPSDLAASPSWKSLKRGLDAGMLTPAQAMLFTVPRPRIELYDIIADPWETNNLADDPEFADVVNQLELVLDEWVVDTDDFPPERRRRLDKVDRFTGEVIGPNLPELIP